MFAASAGALTAALAIGAGPAAAAGIELKHAVAFPMAPGPAGVMDEQLHGIAGTNLVCSPDPTNKIYGNDQYDSSREWDVQQNNPGERDIVRDLQAGKSSDWCVGFALTPNVEEMVIGETYDSDHAWRVQPAQNPWPDEPDTHGWDLDADRPTDGDDMRDIELDLPAGFAAAPKNVDTCTDEQFRLTDYRPIACPASSRIGDSTIRLSLAFGTITFHAPMAIGKLYNLTAGPNEVARIGVTAQPPTTMIEGAAPAKFIVRITMASDGSGRLRAIVKDAPRRLFAADQFDENGEFISDDARNTYLALYIESVGMRIWGAKTNHPSMPADFAESGTNCDATPGARVQVTTYKGKPSTATAAPVTLSGCEALPFAPTVEISDLDPRAGVPTGVTIDLRVPQDRTAGGLRSALLRDAEITLPDGLEVGAQVASGGLRLCTAAQLQRESLAPAACPEQSAIGTVAITTPLIDRELRGTVYLGDQSAVGELPRLYLEAALPGATAADAPRIKLVGEVRADAQGRLTATFRDNPQLRFERLRLTLRGGDRALLVTPRACAATTGRSTLTGWNGVVAQAQSTVQPSQACDRPAFSPDVQVSAEGARAGGRSATTIHIDRPDRAAWIDALQIALPTGFLADLSRASECSWAQAQAAACSADARIGSVRVTAGAGPSPTSLTGQMYLVERESGAVAGVAIIVRAKLGDLDLGDVVVRGRIELRPTDAGLTFTADLPTRFRGLALGLRTVDVTLDREGFPVNPTACGPLGWTAKVDGDGGEQAAPSGSVAYAGCGELPFRPALRATLTGDNRPGGHPGMYVELSSPEGDAGMRSAVVTLPKGVAASLPNVKDPCPRDDFDAVRCTARTRIGSVTARVSITPDVLVGDIFLVKVPGKVLPGLGLSFTGRYAQRVISTVEVNKEGRLVTAFSAIPDLPLRSLVIDVASGPRSPLELPKEGGCAVGTNWDGAFTAQGGQTTVAKTGLQCAATATSRLSEQRGLTVRLFDFGGRNLKYVKATLPAGWRFDRAAARRKGALWVRMDGATAKLRLTSRSVTAYATGAATSVRMKIGGNVVRATSRKQRRAKTVQVPLRLAFTDGAVQEQVLTVPVR
jgi:hypothetical protein